MKKTCIILLTMLFGVVSVQAQSPESGETSTSTDEPVKYTVLDSSGGYGENQGADKLFDYDRTYKWCNEFTNKEEGETTNGAYVIFKTSRVMAPTHYTIITADDTEWNPERNWKQWQLYGMNAESDEDVTRESENWVLLDKKYDVGRDQIPAANFVSVDFSLSEENTIAYKYFKIELDKIIADYSPSMQIADFLLGDEYTPKWVQTDAQGVVYTLNVDNGSFCYSVTGHSEELNTEIVIPEEINGCPVKKIEDNVFSDCTSLTSVVIPNNVEAIGASSFSGCRNLTTAVLGNQLKTIGEYAFSECYILSSMTIPSIVNSIGKGAFNSTALNNVKVVVTDYSGFCNNNILQLFNNTNIYADFAFPIQLIDKEGNEIKEYVIPEGVTSIGAKAFAYCSNLTSVILNSQLIEIGEYAFFNCTNLSSIVIPDNVTTIGEFAFSGCFSLSSVNISNSVTSIGDHAFENCI